jgi:selenium metabolism protein YedF
MTMVDARGLACPQPVVQTQRAMQRADLVVTLVDNETSLTNVSRMAERAGWETQVTREGEAFRIEMARGTALPETTRLVVGKAEALDGPPVVVVSSDVMGRGNEELGDILIRSFFHTFGEIEPLPQTIVFFNTGARLACQGSHVLDDLRALESKGIEMLVCGTCLGYLELKEKLAVGQVSNMYDIAETLLRAGRVVNL